MPDSQVIPTVSVIAICFNHARFVVECLDSIRTQTYEDFELLIVDDCSTDNSVSIIADWIALHDFECKLVTHKINVGICKTLNEAVLLCSGDLICMIATDDRWRKRRLESHLIQARHMPSNVAVIYSDTAQISEAGEPLPLSFLEAQRPGFLPPSGRIFETLVDRNFVHPIASTIRRKAIIDVGGYDEDQATEDYDMWLRLAHKYHFIYSSEIVSDYRIVSTSITRTLFDSPTPGYAYGRFLLCEKWIPSDLLSAKQRVDWSSNQAAAAYWLYFHSDPRAPRCLWKAAFRTLKTRFFLLAVASTLGITRKRAKEFSAKLGFVGKSQS